MRALFFDTFLPVVGPAALNDLRRFSYAEAILWYIPLKEQTKIILGRS